MTKRKQTNLIKGFTQELMPFRSTRSISRHLKRNILTPVLPYHPVSSMFSHPNLPDRENSDDSCLITFVDMHRIAFDAKRLFNNFTGLGNYSRTLVRNLSDFYPDNQYYLYTPKGIRNSETDFFWSNPAFINRLPKANQRLLWRSYRVRQDLQKDKIDLYHGLSHEIPFGIKKARIATVVSIHDLIFKHYPEQYGKADRVIYDWKFKYACRHADRVIAISESTRKDIIDLYDTDPAKIRVIYQSCHPRFHFERSPELLQRIREKYNLPSTYLFYLGSLIERKNLHGIIEAMAYLPKDSQLPLVIVGTGPAAYTKRVKRLAVEKGVDPLLIFLKPAYEDLPALYQLASIFLYPSYYEGFGIPVIESLFSKTPVITSDRSSLPEAVGPGGIQVNPENAAEIAAAIIRINEDDNLRDQFVRDGLLYVEKFAAAPSTTQLMSVYQELLR